MFAERIVKRLRLIMGIAVLLAYGTGFLTGFLVASAAADGRDEPAPAVPKENKTDPSSLIARLAL